MACGPTEHDNSRIEDFAPDISGSPHAEEDEEVPVDIGNGAVDVESAAGEPTEFASAGTAEVIGVVEPSPMRACDGVLQETKVSIDRWHDRVCVLSIIRLVAVKKRCLIRVWWLT